MRSLEHRIVSAHTNADEQTIAARAGHAAHADATGPEKERVPS